MQVPSTVELSIKLLVVMSVPSTEQVPVEMIAPDADDKKFDGEKTEVRRLSTRTVTREREIRSCEK
jgi:hypothetical protein